MRDLDQRVEESPEGGRSVGQCVVADEVDEDAAGEPRDLHGEERELLAVIVDGVVEREEGLEDLQDVHARRNEGARRPLHPYDQSCMDFGVESVAERLINSRFSLEEPSVKELGVE